MRTWREQSDFQTNKILIALEIKPSATLRAFFFLDSLSSLLYFNAMKEMGRADKNFIIERKGEDADGPCPRT